MRERKSGSPEQRVGRAANVTIFLGILLAVLHLLAFSGLAGMAQRSYGIPGLAVSVGLIVVGYGIRFGSYTALFLSGVAFAALTVLSVARLADAATPAAFLRAAVAAWMLVSLCRAFPPAAHAAEPAVTPPNPYWACAARMARALGLTCFLTVRAMSDSSRAAAIVG